MTPKEKALELINEMHNIPDGGFGSIGMYEAKQCALIVVKEILKSCNGVYDSEMVRFEETGMGEFWIKVKQEILTL